MQKYYKNCTSTERIAVKEHETKKNKTSENLGFMVTYFFSAVFCHDLSTRVVLKVGQDSMTPHSIKGFPFLGHLSRNWQRREGGRLYAGARSALSRQGQHYYKALLLNAITPPPPTTINQDPHPLKWIWSVIVLKPWFVFYRPQACFPVARDLNKKSFSPAPFKGHGMCLIAIFKNNVWRTVLSVISFYLYYRLLRTRHVVIA